MVKTLSENLLEAYRRDLADYDLLLNKMTEFRDYLHSCRQHEWNEGFEQELTDFWKVRETCFASLQGRALGTAKIKNQLLTKIGSSELSLSDLKPYLAPESFLELTSLAEMLPDRMQKVLDLDQEMIPRLKQEVEAIKAELHRLQNAQKMKNIYRHKDPKDARFIDKSK